MIWMKAWIGCVMFFGALWGGGYMLSGDGAAQWYAFPLLMTLLMTGGAGGVLFVVSAYAAVDS